MPKGIRLSEFENGEITAQKRVEKFQREILKALGVLISMQQENRLAGQKNYLHNSREELFPK